MKNLNEKFTHFRYKEKDQENFWIWFHPCFQTSQDVADLNDLYKYLDDEWFDDHIMETDDYRYYSTMPKDQIRDEIKSLEQVIYQDCFENFYHLILERKIELLTSRIKKIYVGSLTIKI
ncbi:hypothetical protein [Sphingobacterium sp.]|uniref:hypothetical protein n=1 Tax=Sphingobacterium sp. TaxID=341027 RepID=UPI0031D666E0